MKKSTLKELKRISAGIPKDLLDKLMIEKDVAPSVVEVVRRALVDPDVSAEKKEQLQHLMDSGYMNIKEKVVDPEIEKQIDEYMNKEIERAIKLGRIPDPNNDEDIKHWKKKIKKHNAKRNI